MPESTRRKKKNIHTYKRGLFCEDPRERATIVQENRLLWTVARELERWIARGARGGTAKLADALWELRRWKKERDRDA